MDRSLRHGQAGRKHIELHETGAYGRIAKGSNKAAKTTWGTAEVLCWLMGLHPFRDTPAPPVYARVVTPNLPHNLRNPHPVRQALQEWTPPAWLLGGGWDAAWSPSGNTLAFKNGSTLEFVSSNQDALAQAGAYGVHCVWLDEEMPETIFNENIARLDRVGCAWWLTYVPTGQWPWLADFAKRAAKGDDRAIAYRHLEIWDNLHNLPGGFATGPTWVRAWSAGQMPHEQEVRVWGREGKPANLVFPVEIPTQEGLADLFDFSAPRTTP